MLDAVRWKPLTPDTPIPGCVRLLDQTLLPARQQYLELTDIEDVHAAIKRLAVRGAPAIGCAAAFGLVVAMQAETDEDAPAFLERLRQQRDFLAGARPTAVNLQWALDRCVATVERAAEAGEAPAKLRFTLQAEAQAVLEEDIKLCRSIGETGAGLIPENAGILTHCNAGALATGDYGTALSAIYVAAEHGRVGRVFADETRPLLQGARLTAWELERAGVPVTVICDNMAAQVMAEGRVDLVLVGADRIAANGDVANKIGTYGLAILAQYHNVPFYVAAPYSTIDMNLASGSDIPIEQREAEEISNAFGKRTVPPGVDCYNPAFDVTPARLVTGIVTDRGILRPPYQESLAGIFAEAS